MDSDLQFVLSDSGVSLDGQVAIARRYGSLRKFRAIGDTRAEVRQACFTDFGIPQGTPEARAETASVVSSWEIASEFISKETEVRAESKALGQPRILQTHERQSMIRAVEAIYGHLSDVEAPSSEYLSVKAEEVEVNEPVAASLDEILSRKDSTTSQLQTGLDSSGHIRITRTKTKAKVPSTTEDYRRVLRVEMNAWLCMSARYKAKSWLHNLTADSFLKFVEYILGERVYGIQIPSLHGEGQQRVKPDWGIILNYEHRLRREAFKLIVSKGMSMADALTSVTKDADLKEAYFTTPLALRSAMSVEPPPQSKWQRPNFKGFGKSSSFSGKSFQTGKAKSGKGKSKEIRKELVGLTLAWKTPDGRELCFAFNNGSCDGNCGRVHQCRVRGCYADHPAINHKEATKNGA